MRFLMARLLVAAAVVLPIAGWSTPSRTEPRAPVLTADQEACFGRVYDAAHLKKNPRQKVTSIHVMRELDTRREAENWMPGFREQAIKQFREDGVSTVSAFVTFRDRKGYFHNSLVCDKEGRDGVRCMVECDGGSFRLARSGANSVLLHNNGFVLVGGCGEEVEEGKSVFFSPGADDRLFRLDAQPLAVCRAEEAKTVPIAAGTPLRERFKENEQFCFGRDYDADHLAHNPRQLVTDIRVGRLTPGKEKEDDAGEQPWWFTVKLDVSVTLRTDRKTTTVRYACTPKEASWECQRRTASESPSACSERSIHLVRGPGDEILIHNRNSGLPLDKECETAETGQQYPQRPMTKSDDRTFRLTRMPISACQR